MFWTSLNRGVDLILLTLSLTLLFLLWANTKETQNTDAFVEKIALYKQQTQKMVEGNIHYLEGRVNRIQEMSDSYQSNMSSRVYILEQKIEKMEKENKSSARIVNNNINNATVIAK